MDKKRFLSSLFISLFVIGTISLIGFQTYGDSAEVIELALPNEIITL